MENPTHGVRGDGLVGRAAEIGRLARLLGGAGQPAVVEICGPAGIGKTALADHALAGRPQLVARPVHGGQPLELWHTALAETTRDGRTDAPGTRGTPDGDAEGGAAREGRRLAGAVCAHVASWPHRGAVVLDDVHWADAASLQVLTRLAARADLGADIVLTRRTDDPTDDATAALLGELRRRSASTTITLGGLGRGAVGALIAGAAGRRAAPEVVARVHARTGGNPFHVLQLLASGVTLDGLPDAVLPPDGVAAVTGRLGDLGRAERSLLEAVAVLGDHAQARDAVTLAGLDPPAAEEAERALIGAGLVAPHGAGTLACVHALVREAVIAATPTTTLGRLHADALDLATSPAARAAHAAGAGDLRRAAREAAAGATEQVAAGFVVEAFELAVRGLAHLDAARTVTGVGRLRWDLDAVAARAALHAALYEESERHANRWLAAAAADGALAEASAAARLLADVAWHRGDLRAVDAHLEHAAAWAEGDELETARVASAAAQAAVRQESPDAVAAMEHARATAAVVADPHLDVANRITEATYRVGDASGDSTVGHEVFDVLLDRAAAIGDGISVGRAINNGLAVRLAAAPPAEAWTVYERACDQVERHGAHFVAGKVVRQGVDLAISQGDLATARRLVAGRLPEELDPVEAVTLAAKDGLLAVESEAFDEAAATIGAYRPLAARVQQHWARTYLAWLEVELAARARSTDAAESALDAYVAAVDPADHLRRIDRLRSVCTAALDCGVDPAVVDAAWKPLAATGADDARVAHQEAQVALARAHAAGQVDEVARLAPGILLAPEIGQWSSPHEIADIRRRWAEALAALARPDEARRELAEAARLLERWPGWRRRAVEELAASLATGPSPLTAREQEVAAVVAQGATNARVARQLGISERTVAVHVSRVLAKTGCASRTELAARAPREGWLQR